MCQWSAHCQQTSICIQHPLPLEREGGSVWRKSHLQQQGIGSPTPEPASDGDPQPPDTPTYTDNEGRASMGLPRLQRLQQRRQVRQVSRCTPKYRIEPRKLILSFFANPSEAYFITSSIFSNIICTPNSVPKPKYFLLSNSIEKRLRSRTFSYLKVIY